MMEATSKQARMPKRLFEIGLVATLFAGCVGGEPEASAGMEPVMSEREPQSERPTIHLGGLDEGGDDNQGPSAGSGAQEPEPADEPEEPDQPAMECEPGEMTCVGLTRTICSAAGRWVMGNDCAYLCVDGMCTGECTPGEESCDGDTPRSCSDDSEWVDGAACALGCQLDDDGSAVCLECEPDTTRCEGSMLLMCDGDGVIESQADCPAGCSAGACNPEQVTVSLRAIDDNVLMARSSDPSVSSGVYNRGSLGAGCLFSQAEEGLDVLCAISLLRFDVSELAGAEVISADLILGVENRAVNPVSYRLAAVSTSWSTNSVTWDESPLYFTASASLHNSPAAGAALWTVDATAIVQGWSDGTWPNHGFVLSDTRQEVPSGALDELTLFNSNEDAGPAPELVVTYHPASDRSEQ